MSKRFGVSLTRGCDDTDRATVALVVANAALGSDRDTVVFLSIEGVRLSQRGAADGIHESGFAALSDLLAQFVADRFLFVRPASKSAGSTNLRLFPEHRLWEAHGW